MAGQPPRRRPEEAPTVDELAAYYARVTQRCVDWLAAERIPLPKRCAAGTAPMSRLYADEGDKILAAMPDRGGMVVMATSSPWIVHVPRRARKALEPADARHGTPTGYSYWRCRCDRCLHAGRKKNRRFMALRRSA